MNAAYYLSIQVEDAVREQNFVPEKSVRQKKSLETSLKLWLRNFDAGFPSWNTPNKERMSFAIPLLRMYHSMTTIMVAVSVYPGNEMIYDNYTADFLAILQQSVHLWNLVSLLHVPASTTEYNLPEPSFSIDMGFIPALYFTTLKCRVPNIRRKAIDLLLSAPHREGLWDGLTIASIGRKFMEIEEGNFYEHSEIKYDVNFPRTNGLLDEKYTPLVPELARISNASVYLPDGIEGMVQLTYNGRGSDCDYIRECKTDLNVQFGGIASGILSRCKFRTLK